MHVCLSFIEEIISHNLKNNPNYYISLLCNLCKKYPMAKSMDSCIFFLKNLESKWIDSLKKNNLILINEFLYSMEKIFPGLSSSIENSRGIIKKKLEENLSILK